MNYYPLKLSQGGIDLIKGFEFFVDHAYIDGVGKLTLGYGSTMHQDGSPIKMGDMITEPDATNLLIYWATVKASAVAYAIRNPLNQNQSDAVISLCYNIGVGGFLGSTVLKIINKDPKSPDIEPAWMSWNKGHVNGKLVVLPGLTKRRQEEVNLFFKVI